MIGDCLRIVLCDLGFLCKDLRCTYGGHVHDLPHHPDAIVDAPDEASRCLFCVFSKSFSVVHHPGGSGEGLKCFGQPRVRSYQTPASRKYPRRCSVRVRQGQGPTPAAQKCPRRCCIRVRQGQEPTPAAQKYPRRCCIRVRQGQGPTPAVQKHPRSKDLGYFD